MTTTSSQPPVFSERYELVRHIARGGMAQVYLAKDLLLDRQVALKVLFPELSVDPAFVRRFRREAQAAASLSHRNIVSIYDWGQGESTYCIVMEYVDGSTLSALARETPLDDRRAAQIGADVAGALDYAHGHGVIHRDVKPGNVLIDHQGQVKVADFGIARAVGTKEGLTQTGAVMGTATYFSPEQAQGFAVDARSDVYSLGVVLYEIVAGRAPFTGDNPVSIAYKHVREQPTPLRELAPTIHPDYAAVVAKAMAKDPADRYQTAGELQADLERFAAGDPVLAVVPVPDNTIVAPAVAATGPQPTVVAPGTGSVPHTVVAPEEEVVERQGRRGPLVVLLLALLAILAVVVFFLGRSLGWWESAPTRTIPSGLAGQPYDSASATLRAAGYTHLEQVTEQNPTVPNGDVITTSPPPGSRAKTDKTITVYVSVGGKPVTVPNVVGQGQDGATSTLARAGFKVSATQQPSSSVQQGQVISQDPGAQATAGQGSTVTIVVSSGPAQVTLPSFYGDSVAEASAKLGQLGLNVGGPDSVTSTKVAAGDVVYTSPGANSTVSAGQTVTLYVSSGAPQVTVPNLSGDTASQASAALAAKGLMISTTPVAVTDPTQDGLVQSQNPSAGSTVAPDSTVTVTVGSYSGSTSSTSSTTTATGPGASVTTPGSTPGPPGSG